MPTTRLYAVFQEYFVANDASAFTVLENKENLPWSTYVGVCGMPGISSPSLVRTWQVLMVICDDRSDGSPCMEGVRSPAKG